MSKALFSVTKLKLSCLLGAWLLLFALRLSAQNVTTSTNVYIPEGLLVSVDGSISNSGFMRNNGSITLSGDWQNAAIYQGLGAMILNGSDQQINNNRQSFNSLFINGGGSKTLTGSLTIDRLITFTEGIFITSINDTLRLVPEAEAEGGSTVSHVNGPMTTYGTGYKFFPIGKNGNYHPVELDVTGLAPAVEMEVQENLPAIQSPIPSTPIIPIYWTRKIIRGDYDGGTIAVKYNVREGIEPDQLVMLEGETISSEFIARETVLELSNDLDRIESINTPTGNIIALAELAGEPPRQYYFSTTLSPYASNPENRTIKIFGDNITDEDFRFQVFNRWGLVVYETSSASFMRLQGWDGRHNGNMLPSGAYPYNLTYIDASGKPVKRTGFITIIQ